MKRRRYLFGLSVLSASFAWLTANFGASAETLATRQDADADETRTVATLEVTVEECRRLSRHIPDADVAYQPGVDVRGRAVAPTDLANGAYGNAIKTPETIVIPIEVELFERFGIPANPALFEADAQVGEVIYDNGKLTYNGQRLADGARDEIALYCREVLEVRKKGQR